MSNLDFFQLFVSELEDMYSSENQIIQALPTLIKKVSLPGLKEALKNHLEETKNQVSRIEKIFSILEIDLQENPCEGMKGILREGDEIVKNIPKSPLLDAAIISAAQKVEHYEIASYGTLRSFAKQLELDSEIVDLLQETLKEEGNADKTLTKFADGSIFTKGVNKEATDMVFKRKSA